MSDFERSLDIALSTELPDANRAAVEVVPLTSTESLVAARGLALHMDILYRGVSKKAGEERALLQVFNFLSDDMDKIRRRSHNIERILNPDAPDLDPSRASAAIALASLIRGRRSHQTGVWLRGNASDKEVNLLVAELMDTNGMDFYEYRKQGFDQARMNAAYWRYQLEDLRDSPYIESLRAAIDESDHYPPEV